MKPDLRPSLGGGGGVVVAVEGVADAADAGGAAAVGAAGVVEVAAGVAAEPYHLLRISRSVASGDCEGLSELDRGPRLNLAGKRGGLGACNVFCAPVLFCWRTQLSGGWREFDDHGSSHAAP